jgi:hypothetical protein
MTLTRYIDRRNNMKISKIAIAVLFAAGFLTTSATSSMATSCAEGYIAVEGEFPDPMYTCEPIETPEESVDVKPIDSCWETEDGSEVCARGLMEPIPANAEQTPVEGGDCAVSVDADGNELKACYDAVPYEVPSEEGEGVIVDEGTVDETLMFQSGVTKSGATPNDQTASSALAAFGVLVGALGALGIGISRQRAAKK